jgi:hypothetical protein
MACSGLHCDGCSSCGGGRLAVAVVVVAAVAAFGSALAAFLADVLAVALVVLSAATVAMVAGLAVKMRRGRLSLVQWHQERLPPPVPVKAISGAKVDAYVVTTRPARVREPRR